MTIKAKKDISSDGINENIFICLPPVLKDGLHDQKSLSVNFNPKTHHDFFA
jgi:hypothetical protein